MKIGLQITKNLDKYNKLIRLLDLKSLKGFSFIHIKDNESLKKNIKDLDILVCYKIIPELFDYRSNKLKWIHIGASGVYDSLFDKIIKSKVMITNAKGINSKPVAEFIISQILYFSKQIKECQDFKRNRIWNQWDLAKKTTQLSESTLGIIGYGEIGKELSKIAKSFDMKVIAVRRLQKKEESKKYVDLLLPMNKLNKLIKRSDFIAIACPLTPLTKNMINKNMFKLTKDSAIIINTSRGEIINEDDLIIALSTNVIAGAGIDVYGKEPLPSTHKLRFIPNALILPHLGYVTIENYSMFYKQMIENLDACASGKPIRVINE